MLMVGNSKEVHINRYKELKKLYTGCLKNAALKLQKHLVSRGKF
jgi:hypothetical protein